MSVKKLSVVIIAQNEAHQIDDCLASIAFADEIIVLDSGSTDGTPAICGTYTPNVIKTDWPGDGPQRNRGILRATGDWVLCLDADEVVSPLLRTEIETILAHDPPIDGFYIPFRSYYCGRHIRYGDWRHEKHLRLFRQAKGTYTSSAVYGAQGAHCKPHVEGIVSQLKGWITHHPFSTLDRMLAKLNTYSTGSAAIRHADGQRASLRTAIGHGLWAFIRGYCLKAGFLDGREGFILAMSNAQGTYYRYLKLMYLSEKNTPVRVK